ncbi:hypothetical protein IEE91_07760 [Kocuria sp. cx-455]|uniref:hypothetical protein n=1 Tax=Kocuria sp. cx-455 TaxID=2771377 RepID=UPI0016827746|nr:hypothetical protein [Kocuria sp. cx-455]MBD2765078.1 hypothetical protein [Kocuria sp. cx-455]
MAEESYLALHRKGRLYGPTDQDLVLRTPFEVQQFTIDAQGSLRAEIDTNAFRNNPLSPQRLRVLRYLWEIERSTMGQIRHVVVGYTNKESRVAAFLTTWAYERHWIADAYQAVLEAHGVDLSDPVDQGHQFLERVEKSLDNLAPMIDSVWTNLFGEDVVAGYMARGWSREASMRAALAAFDAVASHPELSALLERVAEIKTVHERFFAAETSERGRHSPRAAAFARRYVKNGFNPLRPAGTSRKSFREFIRHVCPTVRETRLLLHRADDPLQYSPGTAGTEPLRRALERDHVVNR